MAPVLRCRLRRGARLWAKRRMEPMGRSADNRNSGEDPVIDVPRMREGLHVCAADGPGDLHEDQGREQPRALPALRIRPAVPEGRLFLHLIVETIGLEPTTPCLQSRCSTN